MDRMNSNYKALVLLDGAKAFEIRDLPGFL